MKTNSRNRIVIDLPEEIQMAIRLRAIKDGVTTGEVVERLVRNMYPADVKETVNAIEALTARGR